MTMSGWTERAIEFSVVKAVVFFGLWTIACNATTMLGGSLGALQAVFFVALLASVPASWWIMRQIRSPTEQVPTGGQAQALIAPLSPQTVVALALVFLLLVAYRLSGEYLVFFVGALALLCTGLVVSWKNWRGTEARAVPSWENRLAFWLALLLLVTVSLVTVRWSYDLPYYINLSIGILDHPDWPLLRYDTSLGETGRPMMTPAYASLSYEPLHAVIASLTGWEVPAIRDFLFRPLIAALTVLALASLFRVLLPAHWGLTTLLCVLIAGVHGDTFRTLGHFVIVQPSIGKGALVGFVVPAIIWAALRFSRRPTPAHWAVMALAQAAAVGFSPSGIPVAPIAAGLALLASASVTRREAVKLGIGLAASAWPIIVGLWLLASRPVTGAEFGRSPPIEADVISTFGWGVMRWLLLAGVLGSWIFVANARVRRYLLVTALGMIVFLANPLLSDLLGAYASGHLNWRLFWAVPIVPMLTILVVTGAVAVLRSARPLWLLAFALLPVLVLWPESLFHKDRAPLGTPRLQLPEDYANYVELTEGLGVGDAFVAPKEIAAWAITRRHHPAPLVVRPLYLIHWLNLQGPGDANRRLQIQRLIAPADFDEGAGEAALEIFGEDGLIDPAGWREEALAALRDDLAAGRYALVITKAINPNRAYFEPLLEAEGFNSRRSGAYVIWSPPGASGDYSQ